jgi:glutamine amidotransferase
MIGIINYGMGNLASVKSALDYLGIESKIIENPIDLEKMDKMILPGVGAFGMAMDNLNKFGFSSVIKELVNVKQKPILGICLGMQLLLESSTEHGYHKGLGIIEGQVKMFDKNFINLPVPHIGWNNVIPPNNSNKILFKNQETAATYYFVHSYFCTINDISFVAGSTEYGILFHSSIEKNNIFGCQFHPEKSQKSGLNIFKNFNLI